MKKFKFKDGDSSIIFVPSIEDCLFVYDKKIIYQVLCKEVLEELLSRGVIEEVNKTLTEEQKVYNNTISSLIESVTDRINKEKKVVVSVEEISDFLYNSDYVDSSITVRVLLKELANQFSKLPDSPTIKDEDTVYVLSYLNGEIMEVKAKSVKHNNNIAVFTKREHIEFAKRLLKPYICKMLGK